jgi:hypothetical protein
MCAAPIDRVAKRTLTEISSNRFEIGEGGRSHYWEHGQVRAQPIW